MTSSIVVPNREQIAAYPPAAAAALISVATEAKADINSLFASQAAAARNMVTTLAAYAGSKTATLTASANGAWAAQDGVTNAAGDVVFIQGGTTNLTDPADSGPWTIVSLGGASAKWSLARPSWYAHGATIPLAYRVDFGGEGTTYGGTSWKAFCAAGKVVGTDDPLYYVGRISKKYTLTASTVTITDLGVRSATATEISAVFQLAHGTVTSTIGYGVIAAPTPGYAQTASFVIDALAAGMIKNGTADASDIIVTVCNW